MRQGSVIKWPNRMDITCLYYLWLIYLIKDILHAWRHDEQYRRYWKSTFFSSCLTNGLIDIRFVLIDKYNQIGRLGGTQSKHNGKT